MRPGGGRAKFRITHLDSCLVPVRRIPGPSRTIHFGEVYEAIVASSGFSENKGLGGVLSIVGS